MLHFEDFDLERSRTPYIYIYTAPWVLQFGYANWSSLSLLFFLNPCHLCLGSFKFGASGRGANWGDNGGGMVGETGRYWGVTVGGCKPAGWQSGRSAHGLHRAWASQVSNQRRQRVAGNLLEFLWISMNKLKGAGSTQESTSVRVRENMTFESLRSKGGFLYIRVLEVLWAGLPELNLLLLHAVAPQCLRFQIQSIFSACVSLIFLGRRTIATK